MVKSLVAGPCQAGDEALEFVDFFPEGTDEVLLRDHRIGILCSDIRDWHERTGQS